VALGLLSTMPVDSSGTWADVARSKCVEAMSTALPHGLRSLKGMVECGIGAQSARSMCVGGASASNLIARCLSHMPELDESAVELVFVCLSCSGMCSINTNTRVSPDRTVEGINTVLDRALAMLYQLCVICTTAIESAACGQSLIESTARPLAVSAPRAPLERKEASQPPSQPSIASRNGEQTKTLGGAAGTNPKGRSSPPRTPSPTEVALELSKTAFGELGADCARLMAENGRLKEENRRLRDAEERCRKDLKVVVEEKTAEMSRQCQQMKEERDGALAEKALMTTRYNKFMEDLTKITEKALKSSGLNTAAEEVSKSFQKKEAEIKSLQNSLMNEMFRSGRSKERADEMAAEVKNLADEVKRLQTLVEGYKDAAKEAEALIKMEKERGDAAMTAMKLEKKRADDAAVTLSRYKVRYGDLVHLDQGSDRVHVQSSTGGAKAAGSGGAKTAGAAKMIAETSVDDMVSNVTASLDDLAAASEMVIGEQKAAPKPTSQTAHSERKKAPKRLRLEADDTEDDESENKGSSATVTVAPKSESGGAANDKIGGAAKDTAMSDAAEVKKVESIPLKRGRGRPRKRQVTEDLAIKTKSVAAKAGCIYSPDLDCYCKEVPEVIHQQQVYMKDEVVYVLFESEKDYEEPKNVPAVILGAYDTVSVDGARATRPKQLVCVQLLVEKKGKLYFEAKPHVQDVWASSLNGTCAIPLDKEARQVLKESAGRSRS
jgi:hypothetical protein